MVKEIPGMTIMATYSDGSADYEPTREVKPAESYSVRIAREFKKRSEALGYKGKARDRAALEYVAGAAQALHLAGIKDGNSIFFAMLVSTRGYSVIEETLKDRP